MVHVNKCPHIRRGRPTTEKGHIKDLYCAHCDKIVKMRENDFITLADKWEKGL